jgi:hypothetical protein
MKLDPKILKLAINEVNQSLLQDLHFASALNDFLQKTIDAEEYLNTQHGFKKFLYDYRVGRTLQAGDEAKLKILAVIKKFRFKPSHVDNISLLAAKIKDQGLSSGAHGPVLPQSFASKFMSIYKPDEVVPYDSYALKSIEFRSGRKIKELAHYYQAVDKFRNEYFDESSSEIKQLAYRQDSNIRDMIATLNLNHEKLLSWKLTDKYLWCEFLVRKKG